MTAWTHQVHRPGLCTVMSCVGFYSRMSTICSTWCVLREPHPAPQSPAAATVAKLRRIQPAPRWVRHALLTRFLLFRQLDVFLHLPSILFLDMHPIFVNLWRSLQTSHSPPTGHHSRSATAESSDGLRQRSGPLYDHNMYLQLMQRYDNT